MKGVVGAVWIVLLPFVFLSHSPAFLLSIQEEDGQQSSVAEQTILYVSGGSQLPEEYSDRESRHMKDVFSLILFTTIIFVGLSVWMLSEIPAFFSVTQVYWLTSVLIFVSLVFSISFEFFFSIFHSVLFEEGTYVFSSKSLLISFFPAPFFQKLMTVVGIMWFMTIGSIYFFLLCNNKGAC